jgi:hypothetical protein
MIAAGIIAMRTPAEVAMPLPPLKPTHGGAQTGDDLEDLRGEHREFPGVGSQRRDRHRVFHALKLDQRNRDDGGDESLERIEQQAGNSVFFPNHTQHVGRADVAGSVFADVDALRLGDDQAEGDRS